MPDTFTPTRIAELLAGSPGWCRVGLTAPDPRMRACAAEELAEIVFAKLHEPPPPTSDARQMALPIA